MSIDLIDPALCTGCRICVFTCPMDVIRMEEADRPDGDGDQAQKTLCTTGCPGAIDIPAYLAKVREGDLHAAAHILLRDNPFPAITGRLCPHPCESECARTKLDEAVSIREAERFVGDWALANPGRFYQAPAAGPATDGLKPVAIVGSGPAGLSCAYYLRRAGHPVTVFERSAEAGGLLRYAIPAYRLSVDTVRRQIEALTQMGVEFRLGTDVGRDVGLDDLRAEYGAVFVATGAWRQPSLGLEGEELLTPGLPFLAQAKAGLAARPGEKVVVIGGGNVAVDVALTAKRLGAQSVVMVSLECEAELPALPWELEQARAEGVTIAPSWGTAAVLTDGARLTGLELVSCTSVFGEDGCFAPCFDPSSRTTIEADKVFVAISRKADLAQLDRTGGLQGAGGWASVDRETQASALSGVYAGGDVAAGPVTVIAAIAAGRRAAASMTRHLGQAADPAERLGEHTHTRSLSAPFPFNPDFLLPMPRTQPPEEHLPMRLDREDRGTLGREEIEYEANRCFSCSVRPAIIRYPEECMCCDACEYDCPARAIHVAPEKFAPLMVSWR